MSRDVREPSPVCCASVCLFGKPRLRCVGECGTVNRARQRASSPIKLTSHVRHYLSHRVPSLRYMYCGTHSPPPLRLCHVLPPPRVATTGLGCLLHDWTVEAGDQHHPVWMTPVGAVPRIIPSQPPRSSSNKSTRGACKGAASSAAICCPHPLLSLSRLPVASSDVLSEAYD